MKVTVIGAGRWGRNLVRTLHGLGALHGIVEPDPANRRSAAELAPEVPVFDDFEKGLAQAAPAVAIATPVSTHFEIASRALNAGKDVFVEKPLTMRSEDAARLNRLAEQDGRILMVGHLLLYQPAITRIKVALDEGVIGKPRAFHQERLNLGTARSVENALWSLGVHDIAVILHLAGGKAPDRVTFSGQSILQSGIDDDTYLHLEFGTDLRAHVHNSWLWPERRRRLTVIGSQGMLVYDEIAQTLHLHRKRIDAELKNIDEGQELLLEGASEPLKLEMEHFLKCLKTRARPASDGRQGEAVVKILELAQGELQEEA